MAAATALVLVLAACSAPPAPRSADDAEIAEYGRQLSDARWQSMGFGSTVERPVVAEVQYIDPEKWGDRIAGCMNDQGYTNYSAAGGGLSIDGDTTTQPTEERVAFFGCQELFQFTQDSRFVLSEPQLEYVYRYYARYLVPCLEARGYVVRDVPTRAMFMSTGNLGMWNPYWQRYSEDQEFTDDLRVQCPPLPPGVPALF